MLRRLLARTILALLRWELVIPPTPFQRYVLVCAPHTSLWDTVLMLVFTSAAGLRVRWMVKAESLRPPMSWLLNRLGAVPVYRERPRGLIGQMVEQFGAHDAFVLAIAPSATRRRTSGWKTGFHVIAREANVPVVPAFLDYGRRRAGWGPPMQMTADIDADMRELAAFYSEVRGRNPPLQTPVQVFTDLGPSA